MSNPVTIEVTIDLDDVASAAIYQAEAWHDPDDEFVSPPSTLTGPPLPTTLAGIVVGRAASIVAEQVLRSHVAEVSTKVARIRDEVIRARVTVMVDEALAKPIQRTTEYGAPVGAPISIAEMVTQTVTKVLTQNTSYGSRQTLLQKTVAETVEAAFKNELLQAIGDEKAKVVAAVRSKAATVLADVLTEGLKR